MAHISSPLTVAAVVAAHNEEQRLGRVLKTLTSYPGFDEVIVVDDGSTDATAEVARAFGATLLRLPANLGKGAALDAGIRHANTDVLFLADADIRGLDHAAIAAIVDPVAAGEVDMFVAMRLRSIYHVRSVLRFLPLLGGERAVSAKLWHAVPARYKHRFRIEAALNFYAVHHGRGLRYRVLPIRQTLKESKYGLAAGLVRRLRMVINVGAAMVELQLTEAPPDARARRGAALAALCGTVGLLGSITGLSPTSTVGFTAPGSRQRHIPLSRQLAVGATAVGSGMVVLVQLVRLAQSQNRRDG